MCFAYVCHYKTLDNITQPPTPDESEGSEPQFNIRLMDEDGTMKYFKYVSMKYQMYSTCVFCLFLVRLLTLVTNPRPAGPRSAGTVRLQANCSAVRAGGSHPPTYTSWMYTKLTLTQNQWSQGDGGGQKFDALQHDLEAQMATR